MDDNALIRIRHVRKVYLMGEEKVVALDDVSLDIYKGEFVCFLGTSGSGKSTFLNMVAGLEKPTRGEVWIGKVPIHKLNEAQVTIFRQKNIGFIFQAYHLMQSMTALENVALPLMLKGVPKEIREPAAKKALAQVGLKGYEGRKPNQMSGGQQQRVRPGAGRKAQDHLRGRAHGQPGLSHHEGRHGPHLQGDQGKRHDAHPRHPRQEHRRLRG